MNIQFAPQTQGAWQARLDSPLDPAALKVRLRSICAPHRVDVGVLSAELQAADFGLLAMDMDSTLITIECIDEIADFIGKKPAVAAITEATMRGEIKSFADSLVQRVALLRGVRESDLQAVFDERLRLSPGAAALLAFARQSGWKTLLVSGGFTYFTGRLQKQLGLDFAQANTLEIIDGRLTGRVLGDIVDAAAKAEHVRACCQQLNIAPPQAIVMGDGANDLRMMAIAGMGVAFHAKPVVQTEADQAIVFGGLDTLSAWMRNDGL
ncbi:MAG: phosphoserine phosphatase SerB [Burkholderiaceae bacterium]